MGMLRRALGDALPVAAPGIAPGLHRTAEAGLRSAPCSPPPRSRLTIIRCIRAVCAPSAVAARRPAGQGCSGSSPVPLPALCRRPRPQRLKSSQQCSSRGEQVHGEQTSPYLIVPVVTGDNLTLQKGIIYVFYLISFLYKRSTVRAMIHTRRAARISGNSNHFKGNGLSVP